MVYLISSLKQPIPKLSIKYKTADYLTENKYSKVRNFFSKTETQDFPLFTPLNFSIIKLFLPKSPKESFSLDFLYSWFPLSKKNQSLTIVKVVKTGFTRKLLQQEKMHLSIELGKIMNTSKSGNLWLKSSVVGGRKIIKRNTSEVRTDFG